MQERMKNEMLKNDIKEYHNEVTKSTGSVMDDASMQLHMAKKRHADAEMRMKLSRKTFSKETKYGNNSKNSGVGAKSSSSWTTKPIKYPTYRNVNNNGNNSGSSENAPNTEQDTFKAPSTTLHELSAQRSNNAIQSELKRIEEEFAKRARKV